MAALQNHLAVIKVVGVGGGGVNVVNHIIEVGLKGVELIAVNTDAQALLMSDAETKLDIGRELTHGFGTGADPDVGRQAAEGHIEEITDSLAGVDMVFVTTGEGGGTSTGAAPVVTRVARKAGALTVGVVTRPFSLEGNCRAAQAEAGVEKLHEEIDTSIVIPDNHLLEISDMNISVLDVFHAADQVLLSGVQGITELIATLGLINVDSSDVRSVMKDAGSVLMGIGAVTGEDRVLRAVETAIFSPLLEAPIDGAHGVLMFFQGGSSLGLQEIFLSSQLVRGAAHPEANVIFGSVIDDPLDDEIRVTIIAAGSDEMETETSSSPAWQASTAKAPAAQAAPDPSPAPAAMTPAPRPAPETAALRPLGEVSTARPQHRAVIDVPTRTGAIPLAKCFQHPIECHEDQFLEVSRIFDEEADSASDPDIPDFLR